MPGYFKFSRKNDPTFAAVKFCDIDDEMCAHFGVKSDPVRYYRGWYDPIGEALAMGQSLEQIRDIYKDKMKDGDAVKIVEWLMENFTTDAWYSRVKI